MEPTHPDRRQFAAAVAALAASQIARPADAPAADVSSVAPVADALFEAVQARYGEHITKAQTAAVKRGVLRVALRAAVLREVRLTNADGPAVVFRADLP